MQRLVVLTGAGVSAESGLSTFRDAGGLWEGHRIEDVATPEAFYRNPSLVHEFYNQRRTQLGDAAPNKAHLLLKELESQYHVVIITQNVDDLHERAGSSSVLHLHGELIWACSAADRSIRQFVGYRSLTPGEMAMDGAPLRPDIVWFGEAVPRMEDAIAQVLDADIFLVMGTSLEVYPAAGLIHYVPDHAQKFVIDPGRHASLAHHHFRVISKAATEGMQELYHILVP